jgi:general nucleoside transport system permease protein
LTALDLLSVLAATIRLAVPLILAALGGVFSERAGVVALGLEGFMLAGAFAAGAVAAATGSPWAGLGAAIVAGSCFALLHGYAAITLGGEQIVSGIALNILIAGLAPIAGLAWFGEGGATPALAPAERFMPITLPGASLLGSVFGPVWRVVASGHNLMVYGTAILLPVLIWLLYGSRFGLRLRAVGENPEAVDAAGLSVARLRYLALILCGALSGAAGAYLSIAAGAGFSRDMVAGRGYLALAALIFGRWRPLPTCGACLFFALADAIQLRLQGTSLPMIGIVPVQFVEALPYVATLLLLAGLVGSGAAPTALGKPFRRLR